MLVNTLWKWEMNGNQKGGDWMTLLTFTFVGCLVQDCLCWLNLAIPVNTTWRSLSEGGRLAIVLFFQNKSLLIGINFTLFSWCLRICRENVFIHEFRDKNCWWCITSLLSKYFRCFQASLFVWPHVKVWPGVSCLHTHTHTIQWVNAQAYITIQKPCCYERRFQFCFVLANTTGNTNKTQANETQTAAAAAGCMSECLCPYVWDSKGRRRRRRRGDKTALIMAFTTLSATVSTTQFLFCVLSFSQQSF